MPHELAPMANHLWQSTVYLAAAWLLTLALRQQRAQTRYLVWLTASMKFLVPLSMLVAVGHQFEWRRMAAAKPALFSVVDRVSQPFVAEAPVAVMPAGAGSAVLDWLPAVVGIGWFAGFATILCLWWMRWRRVRSVVRSAARLDLPIPIAAVTSPALLEPGIFGIFRPVLLAPAGLTDHLSGAQLDAVLAHEICHVRRRDNFAMAFHMGVEAIFWFHPLVWWLGARLTEERERACDEEVLRLGSDPQAYAEGILKVCEMYVESPFRCVAGVGGAGLAKRIQSILENRAAVRMTAGRRAMLAVVAALAVAGPIAVGVVAQTGKSPAFEVATIRPVPPPRPGLSYFRSAFATAVGISGNQYMAKMVSLRDLIATAYNVQDFQISGTPPWASGARADRYDLAAKGEGDAPLTMPRVRLMLRTLLADRFQLKLHHDTQELPVYVLVVLRKRNSWGPDIVSNILWRDVVVEAQRLMLSCSLETVAHGRRPVRAKPLSRQVPQGLSSVSGIRVVIIVPMKSEAILSAIVVTPGSCQRVVPLIRRLCAQTMRGRMEIVFVTTSEEELEADEELLAGFASWKAAPVGRLVSMPAARAAGIRAASCPYIVFTEQHCFPDEHWAQAIVDAFETHGADAVGPVFGNANPGLPLSWVNLCVEYGAWTAPHAGGLIDHLPGHNSAYRRDLLVALGDRLEAAIESEFSLHLEWRQLGRRLWLEPAARVFHTNVTDFWAHSRAACAFQRPWAVRRARDWGWPRRIAYALAWPLIAAVRLPRVTEAIRRAGQQELLLPHSLPAIMGTLLASAFGEFLGYLGSVGNAHAILLEVELYRERFLSPRDIEGLALFQ